MVDHLKLIETNSAKGVQQPDNNQTAVFDSEIPDHIAKLNAKERKVWQHVTSSLHEYGLIHKTDAILITIICSTFVNYLDAKDMLEKVIKENNGSYFIETPNGYSQPHQAYYTLRALRKDLLQWLPEAALTIASFQKAVSNKPGDQVQGSLFDDPVEKHRREKIAIGFREV